MAAPIRPPKRVHFMAAGRPSKAQRVMHVPCLDKPECEGTMKNITGAERVDRLHLEGVHVPDLAIFKPVDPVGAVGESQEAFEKLPKLCESGAQIVQPRGPAQCLRRGDHVAAGQ